MFKCTCKCTRIHANVHLHEALARGVLRLDELVVAEARALQLVCHLLEARLHARAHLLVLLLAVRAVPLLRGEDLAELEQRVAVRVLCRRELRAERALLLPPALLQLAHLRTGTIARTSQAEAAPQCPTSTRE